MREALFTFEVRSGVAELDDLAATGKGTFTQTWPAAAQVFYRDIRDGAQLERAYILVPRGAVVSVLDSVGSRLLDFALEIEALSPDAGEATGAAPLPAQAVSQVFNDDPRRSGRDRCLRRRRRQSTDRAVRDPARVGRSASKAGDAWR